MAGRIEGVWLRGVDLNHRPLGYEPNELPDCSTPQFDDSNRVLERQTTRRTSEAHLRLRESVSRDCIALCRMESLLRSAHETRTLVAGKTDYEVSM